VTKTGAAYHHGDLRAALVRAALELLEESGASELSLRGVARRAGVAPSAPYRHYPDRDALLSAVAAVGYRELTEKLATAHPSPSTPDDLAAVAVAYVEFARQRPALFRVMFGGPCDRDSSERAAATAAVSAYVGAIAERAFPRVIRRPCRPPSGRSCTDLHSSTSTASSTARIPPASPSVSAHPSMR